MKKGFALVLLIFLLVASSLIAIVAFSLLSRGTTSGLGLSQSMQAQAIAVGAKEWYLQQLKDDSDWTDEAGQTDIALGAGTFDIAPNSVSANRVSFIVTGKVPGYLDQTVQRQINLTAYRLPKACRFAVFWQEDGPGTRLTLETGDGGTQISGNFWSVGSSRISFPCAVTDGWVYYGAGETVDGSGAYTAQEVQPMAQPPFFSEMPVIDTTYYDDLMTDWNSRINAADEDRWGQRGDRRRGDWTLNSDVDWTGQTIDRNPDTGRALRDLDTNGYNITGTNFTVECRNFNLRGGSGGDSEIDANASNFTIECRQDFTMRENSQINANDYAVNCSDSFNMIDIASINSNNFSINLYDNFDTDGTVSVTGNGYIVCSNNGQVLLHDAGGDSGTFTATASGGNIYFLSGDTMTINSTRNDTDVILDSGCFLYSRNPSGRNDLLRIRNEDTSIDGAIIIAERRIIVEDGADITNSTLYVDYASSNRNNLLQITDSGTTVSEIVISRGRAHPSLRINNGASVSGLLYQYASPTRGRTQVDGGSTITGALLGRQFQNDSLGPATITYDFPALLAVFPDGWDGYVMSEPYSWDDN